MKISNALGSLLDRGKIDLLEKIQSTFGTLFFKKRS